VLPRATYHSNVFTLDAPAGYSIRVPSLEDARQIADLVNDVSVAEIGIPWTSVEEVCDDLTAPGRDVGDDALIFSRDGGLVGYLRLWGDADELTRITVLVYVRPALWGRGLSAWLLQLGEGRARDKVRRAARASPTLLSASRWAENDAAGKLFESLGYAHARTFYVMRMQLDGPIAETRIPDRISIRAFDRERDTNAVHVALMEAFGEDWGHASFDQWVHEHIEGESSGFDAGLWFVALDGDEVVGAVCSRSSTPRSPDAAHVDDLGVRSVWRRRGVGRALLLAALRELRHRGIPAAELGVDSENRGATRLYEGVGMRIVRRAEAGEKQL
jgi:mycothiol synthase